MAEEHMQRVHQRAAALAACAESRLLLGDVEGACGDFREASRIDPSNIEYWQRYEELFHRMSTDDVEVGQEPRGLAELRQSMSLDSNPIAGPPPHFEVPCLESTGESWFLEPSQVESWVWDLSTAMDLDSAGGVGPMGKGPAMGSTSTCNQRGNTRMRQTSSLANLSASSSMTKSPSNASKPVSSSVTKKDDVSIVTEDLITKFTTTSERTSTDEVNWKTCSTVIFWTFIQCLVLCYYLSIEPKQRAVSEKCTGLQLRNRVRCTVVSFTMGASLICIFFFFWIARLLRHGLQVKFPDKMLMGTISCWILVGCGLLYRVLYYTAFGDDAIAHCPMDAGNSINSTTTTTTTIATPTIKGFFGLAA